VKEDLSDLQQESQMVWARLQEHEYLYNKYGRSEDREKKAELAQQVEDIAKRQEPIFQQKLKLEKKIEAITTDIEKYTAELARFPSTDRISELEKQLKQAQHPEIKIQQVYIDDLNKADRCISCHLGIDRSVNVSNHQPFTRHPGDFIYLGNHPIEKFGCTVCHWGQGRATSSVDKAHGRIEYWTRPMFKGQFAQATCQKCHEDFKSLRGASLLSKGEEVLEKYACWGCHIAAGYENRPQTGPPLIYIGQKVNYSWVVNFFQNPKSIYPDACMPKFGLSEEEAKAVADYLFSLSRDDRSDILVEEEVDEDLAEKVGGSKH